MIPKIIHYCWFGNKKIPSKTLKLIKKWKKIMPDYKFICWNENNFDVSTSCVYVKKAYSEKKWAFVSDYVRLYAMYFYGGIYLDTDVEVLQNFDKYLDEKMFISFESNESLCTAIMGCEQGNVFIKKFLDTYNYRKFDFSRVIPNSILIKNFIEEQYCVSLKFNEKRKLNDLTIYERYVFGAKDNRTHKLEKNKDTIAIHHFDASWYGPIHKILHNIKKYLIK